MSALLFASFVRGVFTSCQVGLSLLMLFSWSQISAAPTSRDTASNKPHGVYSFLLSLHVATKMCISQFNKLPDCTFEQNHSYLNS